VTSTWTFRTWSLGTGSAFRDACVLFDVPSKRTIPCSACPLRWSVHWICFVSFISISPRFRHSGSLFIDLLAFPLFFSFRLSGFFASLLSYVSWLANPIPPRRTPHLVLPVLMLSPTISTVRFSPYGLMKWTGGVCGERLGWCIWLGPLFPSYSWCKLGTGLRMR